VAAALHLYRVGCGYWQLAAASCGDPLLLPLLLLGAAVVQLLVVLRSVAAGLAYTSWRSESQSKTGSAVGASCLHRPSCRTWA
jgi:hypothetical protein